MPNNARKTVKFWAEAIEKSKLFLIRQFWNLDAFFFDIESNTSVERFFSAMSILVTIGNRAFRIWKRKKENLWLRTGYSNDGNFLWIINDGFRWDCAFWSPGSRTNDTSVLLNRTSAC